MISNPKYGWCKFEVNGFVGHPSYLTMVPIELLEGFIAYFCNKHTIKIFFDEEGTTFHLILEDNNIRIEKEDWDIPTSTEKFIVVKIERDAKSLAQELIADIEGDLSGWANFDYDENTETKNKEEILKLIEILKTEL